MEDFFTIENEVTAEVTEKKSKFIANIFYVENKTAAEDKIKEIKKKYHDARHNCVAYRIIEDGAILEKSSDDGEPSGTAGAPMLEIIRGNNLCNVLVIVTRYFGGILLGTGGLVRAYSEATSRVVNTCSKICKCKGEVAEVVLDYNNIEQFKYYCKNTGINIINMEYSDVVNCKIEIEKAIKEKLIQDIETKKLNIKKIKFLCEKYINKCVK